MALSDVAGVLRGSTALTAEGWLALEAVLVALAGAEPALTAPGGRLAEVEASQLRGPSHRWLWSAYARLRSQGLLVAPLGLDVLGDALEAVGCDDPAPVVAYVAALWAAGWRDAVGLSLTRAVELLRERDAWWLAVEAHAARGAALGLTGSTEPEPVARVSKLAVRGIEAGNVDTPPRPPAAIPRGDAGESPARGSAALKRCPSPIHRGYHDAYRGTLEAHPVACGRHTCAYCGPRWIATHVDATVAALEGREAWRVIVPKAQEAAVLKRVKRAGGDYRRVPTPDAGAVLLVTSVKVPEAEALSAADVPTVLGDALEAVRTVRGAKVTASKAWSLATVERAAEAEAVEPAGEYVGNITALERFERVVSWWRGAASVDRVTVNGYATVRAAGVTPQLLDALRRNGVLTRPDDVRAEAEVRALKKREAERREECRRVVAALRAVCPWSTVRVVNRAAA